MCLYMMETYTSLDEDSLGGADIELEDSGSEAEETGLWKPSPDVVQRVH